MPLTSLVRGRAPAEPTDSRAVRAERGRARRGPGGRGGAGAHRNRLRRVLSALLAAAAVAGLGRLAVDRPVAGGVPVVVATTQVAAGTVLGAAVLEVRHLPGEVIPAGAVGEVAQVVGRPAASVLSAGEVVTGHDVGASELLTGHGGSTRAVYVPVPETVVLDALGAGDRVDVHSPVDGSVVAADVLVLSVHRGSGTGSWTPGVGTVTGGGAWLAVGTVTATDVAAARGSDPAGGALILSLLPADGGSPARAP
ncbi:SAF domain-containing protein [Ornithinimicrobium cerasi]|uniref:SAF domain-containing protein n=1 Tax=Ornithinimicrobium cerasi TaxID=2248773 RepID=A0A285VLB7_9MICO|nr:SAF domain-containing protein [Ornithinimicrobium cerasi]SOC54006.1 SAF domain-containing protein [Ornithinimicrobium cerasi]